MELHQHRKFCPLPLGWVICQDLHCTERCGCHTLQTPDRKRGGLPTQGTPLRSLREYPHALEQLRPSGRALPATGEAASEACTP